MSDTTCREDTCDNCLSIYDTVRTSFDRCSVELSLDGGGDAFNCYTDLDVEGSVFEGGNYWDEGWHIAVNLYGIIAIERWELYPTGTPTNTSMDKEIGWAAAWHVEQNRQGEVAREDFDYSDTSNMDEGEGFESSWHIYAY